MIQITFDNNKEFSVPTFCRSDNYINITFQEKGLKIIIKYI